MTPSIDLHCDTLSKLCLTPCDFLSPNFAHSHITLPGLRASGALLQCFALFTDLAQIGAESSFSPLQQQLACFHHFLEASDGALVQVFSYQDILENQRHGTLSALLTLEESCLSDNPVTLLPFLYSLGIRMATLTWNHPNLLGHPAAPQIPPAFLRSQTHSCHGINLSNTSSLGLTPSGFDFIAEAERLGILIDVSHLSDAGFYDVATHCNTPFLASHSNARAVCDVPRNLSDHMLRTLAEHGGITGLNLHEPFLVKGHASPEELLDALVRHATHIIHVAGIDTLALGTDFDGIPGNSVIPNVSHLFRLEHSLKKAGLTSGSLDKIFYQNALRFFHDCLS